MIASERTVAAPGGLRTIARDGGLLFAARLIAQASRLGYVLLVVRALGPDLYGVLVYLQAWGLMFLPLVNMGSQALLSRAFGCSLLEGQMMAQRLWTLRLVAVPVLTALIIGLGMAGEPDPAIRPLFLIIGAALVGRGLAAWSNNVLVANRRSDQVLVIELVFRLGEVAAAALALKWGAGITALLAIHAVGWWLQAASSALWVGAKVVRPAWRWRDLGGLMLLRQNAAAMMAGLALFTLLQGPVVLGRHVLGTEAVLGQLGLAMQLLSVLAAVPNALGIAALPVLVGAGADLGRRYLRFVVPASVVVALALAGISAVAGGPVLGLLFGERFAAAAPLLTVGLLVLLVPLAPAALLSQAALASTRPGALRHVAVAALGGLAGGLLAAGLAVPRWGAEGILFAAGGGAVVWLLLLIRIHLRLARTPS